MITLEPRLDQNKRRDEAELTAELISAVDLSTGQRNQIVSRATTLVERIRAETRPGMMEAFLGEFGLSTEEGVALMCLAEALLRVPDASTMDALIEDKIASSDWSSHIGQSSSPLVNASTWGLLLTGKVLDDTPPGVAGTLRLMIRRLGEPVIRTAVSAAMRQMGAQFVLGETIEAAMTRAEDQEARGYTYSYDMLGEAAMTTADAEQYRDAYAQAITAISRGCTHDKISQNPGISVKLSALHPRYEVAKKDQVLRELVPILRDLARQAARAGMGLNVDAEEADRLSLSIAVIDAVLADPELAGWDGFGVVVQAYGRRAGDVIDTLYERAVALDRKIMVRLVKGAYWDTEIKHAQVQGLTDFPVFTRKQATDVSYLSNARKLLRMTDRIYPQFATHNAHSVAAILEMSEGLPRSSFEFQRLHGMGEALHDLVLDAEQTGCRIYAPVGAHRDLLAYLVRRLLENGANSSFVNQIVDESVPASEVASCPFAALEELKDAAAPLRRGPDLFAPKRANAKGFDLADVTVLKDIDQRRPLNADLLYVEPLLAAGPSSSSTTDPILDPATGLQIGEVRLASTDDVERALECARPWDVTPEERSNVLRQAAELIEEDFCTAFSLLAREAGKTLADAVAELREAVDFLHYYAAGAKDLANRPRGVFTCISPWNFPLAIFTGQVSAALAAGNAVLAKPAETTPAIAAWAVNKLHAAGVPLTALQLLPGHGASVGAALTSDARINGVAFTGSTATAKRIQHAMADGCAPGTPLIAETGGLNAMIVDSTALPEQAVRDIVVSAFQSAGQRCSALRCLYIQDDIAEPFLEMLRGAMDALELGNPWALTTDVGPVITPDAKAAIEAHIKAAKSESRLLHFLATPDQGSFVGPALIRVNGVRNLQSEVFGPVLHVATFKADQLSDIIADINATGYGLTFGLHSRIDDRIQTVAEAVHAGNLYVNRNQIGAIVGSQPFGGEGLSGTGPKAGGPLYLERFTKAQAPQSDALGLSTGTSASIQSKIDEALSQAATAISQHLPGPTGELNRLTIQNRPPILCMGPGDTAAQTQSDAIKQLGGQTVTVTGPFAPEDLTSLSGFGGVIWWGDPDTGRDYARALCERDGVILPLITDKPDRGHACFERHLCVDTTASGGNASLLSGAEEETQDPI